MSLTKAPPRPCADCKTAPRAPMHAYCVACRRVRNAKYAMKRDRKCRRCGKMKTAQEMFKRFGKTGYPQFYIKCQPCRTELAQIPKSSRGTEDLTVLAEKLFCQGRTFHELTEAEKRMTLAWARDEATRRGLIAPTEEYDRRRRRAA